MKLNQAYQATGVRERKVRRTSGVAKKHAFIEQAPDPTFFIDSAGDIAAANTIAEQLFGYKKSQLIGKSIGVVIPDLVESLNLLCKKDFFSRPEPCKLGNGLKLYGQGKDGNRFLIDASLSRLSGGKEIYTWLSVRESSERARGDKDSKLKQVYTRSLIEASLDPLMAISPEGKITDVNEASVRLTDTPRKGLIGTDFASYFTEPVKAREAYQQVFEKGFISDYPLTVRDKNGRLTEVLYNASIYRGEDGKVVGASASARDVTDQKRASHYARSLIEASPDPLVTISLDGKITDVNEASVNVTGVSRKKLIGTDFSDYFTEPEKAREGYRQVFANGKVADYPLTLRDRKGQLIEVLYNATVYKDDAGNVLGVLATARDITQVKRTSKYVRSLIEASPDPLVTISPEGKITDVNEASVQATGVSREALIGTDFSDYFTEPHKAREGYKQVFAKGFVADFPLTIRNKSGRLIQVLYNASVYKGDRDVILGAVASARDVTVLKSTEEKIRKIQAYTRSLIETSLDPQITKGPDGRITDVNEATVQVTGVSREKLIGTHFPSYFTEPKKAEEAHQKAFYKGSVKNYPLAIRHVSGKITDVLYSAVTYKDQFGEVQGVFAAARDITDRKQAEEEIKKQQAYTRSLIEASLDPLVTISPEGKITDVNEASVRATGVSRWNLIGTDFSEYFTEPGKAREGYQQVFARGFVSDYPLTIRHNLRDVLYNASVYRDENGKVLGVFAAARDITAQRRQESKIKTLNEELEQRIIELESFSYSVSHDLRAPLRAIDGFIAIFMSIYFSKVDEEGQRLLGNVRRNVDKMGSLIDELLTLSRIGMKDIQITTIDMNELADTVLEELKEARGKSKVTIYPLEATQGDIALIKQVLVNLLSNAFKYSNKKEVPVIEMGSYAAEGETHYYVKDNGVGFDMEYSNKLFGVFQRLHDPQEYQGTGVGLAIVKRIVTRHGGRVWAEGKEDEGATFYFSMKAR